MEFYRQLSRADVLLGQSRYQQAEELLQGLMSDGAGNIDILKMMVIAKMGLHKYTDADQLCEMIIELNPNEAFAFYIKANIKSVNRKFDVAKEMMVTALQIEPSNDDFHAFVANLFLQTKDYEDALKSANTALEVDAENIDALNARSSALVGLGRKEEAFQTIDKSLATDPNNPYTHANMGWGLLHQGKSVQALDHFKMSLKEDPMNQYAKAGMLEAMKAKFPIYRYFLMAMLALSKLKGKNQWIIIIGSYLALRLLTSIAEKNEALWPYLAPFIFLIALFFISTWIFSPLMNLYLLTNKFGRYTLDDEQKLSAKLVGVSFAVSIISLLSYLFTKNEGFLSFGIFSFLVMIPFGSMFNPILEANQKKLQYFTIAIVAMIIINGFLCIAENSFTVSFSIIPLIALIAYQWYANYVMIKE